MNVHKHIHIYIYISQNRGSLPTVFPNCRVSFFDLLCSDGLLLKSCFVHGEAERALQAVAGRGPGETCFLTRSWNYF